MPSSSHNFQDGRHIIAARAMTGLTQDQLAKASNLSRGSVKRWERSVTLPRRGYALEALETALRANGVVVQKLPVVSVMLVRT